MAEDLPAYKPLSCCGIPGHTVMFEGDVFVLNYKDVDTCRTEPIGPVWSGPVLTLQ